ncbi:hypothetical protein [Flavobacterium defluvii]|uniref:Beta-lactamase-inhibitor-like, PepSY-like n=1 Tax=Flavobacterium defluvii TaxID=370979 RepID=A0A1M5LPM4_9FLAO|nr:hypothetical protein [Flavobacterium defluvii]SHG67092.1 hypothetical protein SAMN05443663_103430 [Flavobacterium defluvii]
MKKLILSAAIILGGLSIQAAVPSQSNSVIKSVNIQDEYTEVAVDAVPAGVKSTVEKSFVGSKLEKAWKNAKDEYKLEISKEGKKYTFFTDASGNIIKK